MANELGALARAGTHRKAGWAAALALSVLALTACAGSTPAPAVNKTVPAPTDLPQAPPAVPSKPVTQVPLGPPGANPGLGPVSTGPVKVGLLLPLTGTGANVGTEMLNAAQLALFDLGEDRFQLMPRDTKGSPAEAAEAARRMVADGVKLILGPLFSPEVGAVKPAIQGTGVSELAFTNDWQRAGNGTFVMGLVPADQVSRVVGFAQMRGLQRLAVLAPRNPYGDAVVAAVRDSATRRGVSVVREERYGTDNADMNAAVARLSGGGRSALDTQRRELAMRTDEASRAALARLQTQEAQGAGSFDSLLVAEGGDRLRALLPMLTANRIDTSRVKLLGTGLWDDPALISQPLLAGAWFAAPAPQARADFEGRFEGMYRHRPQRLATLAYDATALAAVLAKSPATAGFDSVSLTNPSGFSGVDGIFRLRTDGLVERGLAVIEIAPLGARVIDEAPASFEALIN